MTKKNNMEILDLYDDLGNKLNETIVRGEKTECGKNIMLSVACIRNSKGKILIQKTSNEKGNKYSLTCGHVIHGESGLDTIKREIKEELGLDIKDKDITHINTFKYPKKNCIFNVYLLNMDISLSDIKLQQEEVAEVKYLTISQIKSLIDKKEFLESHAYIFNNYIN